MTEMIERVAQALAQTNKARDWAHMTEAGKSWWRTEARAAIEAMREPTDAMCDAAEWHQQSDVHQYQAAIDQALGKGAKV